MDNPDWFTGQIGSPSHSPLLSDQTAHPSLCRAVRIGLDSYL